MALRQVDILCSWLHITKNLTGFSSLKQSFGNSLLQILTAHILFSNIILRRVNSLRPYYREWLFFGQITSRRLWIFLVWINESFWGFKGWRVLIWQFFCRNLDILLVIFGLVMKIRKQAIVFWVLDRVKISLIYDCTLLEFWKEILAFERR